VAKLQGACTHWLIIADGTLEFGKMLRDGRSGLSLLKRSVLQEDIQVVEKMF
jgi:hypothetical protein